MIRTTTLSAVLAVAGLGFTGQAAIAADPVAPGFYPPGYYPPRPYPPRPYPPPTPPRHDVDYVVMVKCPTHGHWEFYGRYETRWEAERVEWRLERQGRRAWIKPVHGGPRPYPW